MPNPGPGLDYHDWVMLVSDLVRAESRRSSQSSLPCAKQLVLLEQAGHFPIESPGFEQMEAAVVTFIQGFLDRRPVGVQNSKPAL